MTMDNAKTLETLFDEYDARISSLTVNTPSIESNREIYYITALYMEKFRHLVPLVLSELYDWRYEFGDPT